MKNTVSKYFAFFMPLLSILLLFGCSDNDIPEPSGSTQSGIEAVVNGNQWASSSGNYRLGTRNVLNGASAFIGASDTLTIIGVQVQGTDTSAIMLSVKLRTDRVGTYRIRNGGSGDGRAYFFPDGISDNALEESKGKYGTGITNGELQLTVHDPSSSSISGNFSFSMSAPGEVTYTVVAGAIENVTY